MMSINHLSLSLLLFVSFYTVNTFGFTKTIDLNLSWNNCGPNSDSIQLQSLSITPDPIRIPGGFNITGSASVALEIPTDVHVTVLLERKVGPFFVKVPCVDNFGSCNYGNACELWAEFCPKYAARFGLPCECPIAANIYSVSNANIVVDKKVPPELLGEYRATVDIGSSQNHLGCVNIDLSVKK
ncbi:unnamed protein product [Adineta steineri]|uniref:MD-2-related lipid-recognition domain-containing protein n=1 Tax=Adineta steineri TaxID=433720 RepID=A0A819DJK8_9BILA|nr:unnamed protein product [Adineta steineri]CAF3839421.1 unnamed protein product [Adineta steineri]